MHRINQRERIKCNSVGNQTLPLSLLRIVEYKKERAHTDTERDLQKLKKELKSQQNG